jgi:hypothetical protein
LRRGAMEALGTAMLRACRAALTHAAKANARTQDGIQQVRDGLFPRIPCEN